MHGFRRSEFAAAAPNRHLVTVDSLHDIPLDRPDVVEAQIEAMAKTVG